MLRRADSVHRQLLERGFAHKRLKKCFRHSRIFPPLVTQWATLVSAVPLLHSSHSRSSDAFSPNSTPKHLYLPPQYSTPSDIQAIVGEVLQDIDGSLTYEKVRTSPKLLHHVTHHESVRKLAETLAESSHPSKSFRFLGIAHALGCKTKPNAYEAVSFRFASKKQWDAVLSAVSLAEQHLGHLTSRLLEWRTRACVEIRDYTRLEGILEDFKKYSVVPKRRTFHLILSGHLQNSDLSMAKKLLKIMAETRCPPDASTHALIATHYRTLGQEQQVEDYSLKILQQFASKTVTTVLNSLIQIRLDAHDLPGALRLLAVFDQNQVTGIVSAMTTQDADQALVKIKPVPHHIPDHRYLPSAKTYSIFINHQTSKMELPSAFQIFRNMTAAGVNPTSETMISLIHLFFAAVKGDIAVRMVAGMCSAKGVSLSLFNPILSSQIIEDFPLNFSHIPPNTRIFNALLNGVLRTHGLEGAGIVLYIMQITRIKPNAATLRTLMTHVRTVERSSPGVLLRLLRRHSPSNARATLQHIHIIFGSVLRREKFLLLGSGWDHVAARHSPHRRHTLLDKPYPERRLSVESASFEPTAGIELPWALSYKQLAHPVIEDLQSRGVLSDRVMLSLRIRHEALIKSDISMAKAVFRTLLNRGMHPNEYHFSALMEGLANSGDMDAALDIMDSAASAGVKPNVVMFTILITGHGRHGRPDKAMQVFNDMLASGISPDVPAIDAVASAFFVVGGYSMARKVLVTFWSHIQPFPKDLHHARLKELARIFRTLYEKNRAFDKTLSKSKRLALHIKLKWLKKIWENELTKLPKPPLFNPVARYRLWRVAGKPKRP